MPRLVPRLWSNWLTLLGAALATLSGLAILLALTLELVGPANTYTSSVLFLALPLLFILGLALIPLGLVWERRRRRRPQSEMMEVLTGSWDQLMKLRSFRRNLLFVVIATAINVVLLGAAGHRAVTYMDTPHFCGTICHTVMEPEWTAYLDSPHSRVDCVQCHIGPGASWAVRSKLDGVRQIVKVAFDSYRRPIPTPVHDLRPSRDTCERCHRPHEFHGDRLVLVPHFEDDRENTPAFNLVQLKVGGLDPQSRKLEGIHWHVNPRVQVRYVPLDEERTTIGAVSVWEEGRLVKTYLSPDGDSEEEAPKPGVERLMDCIDCHNRPTHVFARDADQVVNAALDVGELDPEAPFMKKVAVKALTSETITRVATKDELAKALREGWDEEARASADVERTAAILSRFWERNVFPRMQVGWGTYRSHLGHTDESPGCFRCHDGEHETAEGETLSRSCTRCHWLIAQDEDPKKIDELYLRVLGRER